MKIRNQLYRLEAMEDGDIFYLNSDRKKTLLRLNNVKPFELKKYGGYTFRYVNCRKAYPEPGQLHVEPHKASTWAVYLRNINEQPKEPENSIPQ